jgi:hypothetical protein
MATPPMLTRKQLAAYLREQGYPVTENQLAKACAPSRNEGPAPDAYWGRTHLYKPANGLAWAKAKLRRPVEQSAA